MRLASSSMHVALLLSCLVVGQLAHAQESALQALVGLRIQDDLSGVCIAAARVAPTSAGFAIDQATRCAGTTRSLPARPGALFEIGSISKAFTGVLLAEMIERGEVGLDDPLQKYLPAGTRAPAYDGREITLRDLVTHTSELPRLPLRFRPAQPRNPYADLDSTVVHGSLADVKLEQAPGVRYAYSNWGFMLLSDALGRRAGKPYDQLLRERVLTPLGMGDTRVGGSSGVVPGHTSGGRSAAPWDIPAAYAGVGAIRSTPADMAKFARALLGAAGPDAPDSLRRGLAASQKKLRDGPRNVGIGMAWHLIRHGEQELVSHNGSTAGFSSTLVVDPKERTAAIVLADAAGGFDDLAFRLVNPAAPMSAPRRAVALDRAAAQAAVGRYELRPGLVLDVAIAEDKLYAHATGQGRFELLQDSRGDYYPVEFDALLRFVHARDGKVSGVSLFQGGDMVHGKRIDG